MKIDLSEIVGNPGMHATVPVDEKCPPELGITCTSPVKGKLNFTNTGTLLLVDGEIQTDVKLECGRCLIDFTMPVSAEVEEEFRLEKVGDAFQALPLDEEDVESPLVHNNLFDVQELVRQDLLTALPIQPLCRPDCQGLCPTCGENLNMRKCLCPPAEPESPFKALASLLEEEGDGKSDD